LQYSPGKHQLTTPTALPLTKKALLRLQLLSSDPLDQLANFLQGLEQDGLCPITSQQ